MRQLLFLETYTQNLIAYLKRISCHINMDMGDFRMALAKLKENRAWKWLYRLRVQPSLMFGRELVAVWKEMDTGIGPDKIFAHFSVSLSDQQDSITEQWINCLMTLIIRHGTRLISLISISTLPPTLQRG